MKIASEAAQRSILGPDFWNALGDNLLRLEMPDELHLVKYADDVVALVTARTIEQAQRTLEVVIRRVSRGMAEHGFTLVLEKTEVIVLTKGSTIESTVRLTIT